jgi:hypothetical protein
MPSRGRPPSLTGQDEPVNDTATEGIPQEGGVFVLSRRRSYPISRFIVWFASVCSHFHKESGKAQSDPVVQKEAPAPLGQCVAILRGVKSRVLTRSDPVI